MAQKTYRIGDRVGVGRTLTEARADAEHRAAHALKVADGYPSILAHRGLFCVVFPRIDGWLYTAPRALSEMGPAFDVAHTPSCGYAPTRAVAEQDAIFHMAQSAWTPADGVGAPDTLTDPKRRESLVWWQEAQLRMAQSAA